MNTEFTLYESENVRKSTITKIMKNIFALLIDLLLFMTLFVPFIMREADIDDAPRLCHEYYTILFGIFFIISVQLNNIITGKRLFSSAATSKTRLFAIILFLYLILNTFFAFNPLPARKHLASFLCFLLIAQSFLDWLTFSPKNVRKACFMIAFVVFFQLILGTMQFNGIPDLKTHALVMEHVKPNENFLSNRICSFFWSLIPATNSKERVYANFNNPNFFAEFLVLTVPVIVLFLISKRKFMHVLLSFLFFVPTIIFLYYIRCRAAWLGLISSGSVIAATFGTAIEERKRPFFMIAISVIFITVFSIGYFAYFSYGSEISSDQNIEGRLKNWKIAYEIWLDNPVLGCGLGNYKLVSEKKILSSTNDKVHKIFSVARFFQVHNELLQILVEFGTIGIFIAFVLIFFWISEVFKNTSLSNPKKAGILWGIIGLITAAQFGFPFHIPGTMMFFLIIACLGIYDPNYFLASPDPSSQFRVSVIRILAFAMLSVLLVTIFFRAVHPVYIGAYYEKPTPFLMTKEHYKKAESVLFLADRYARYKGDLRTLLIKCFFINKKDFECTRVFELSKYEGIAVEALYYSAASYFLQNKILTSAYYLFEFSRFARDNKEIQGIINGIMPKIEVNPKVFEFLIDYFNFGLLFKIIRFL
ncbi:MAG: O-antigen ligase family protein [Candidatus Riflebacteria bacterium]|nr:O-antigen ligase family protein [Candidatus Riflebacteria bacterium]